MKREGVVSVLAVAALAGLPSAALAHAGFVSSTPEAGSTLGTAPGRVTLTFSEPLNEKLSSASVRAPDGAVGQGGTAGDDQLAIDLTTNQTGVYEVMWTTVSLVDGHTLSGSFRFGVGVSPGAGAEGGVTDEPRGGDLLVAIGRVVEDASLFLLIGLLLLLRLARREPAVGWVRAPIAAVFVAAFAGGIAVVIGEALLAASSLSIGRIVTYLTTGEPGWVRSIRVVVEGAGVVVVWRWGSRAAPFAVAALILLSSAGHAAAVSWGVPVEAVHLVSAGLWAGGIMALAFQRPPEGWLGPSSRVLLDRFTPVALGAFAVTAATGIIRGVQEVGSLQELWGSSYGLVLLVKVFIVLLVAQLSFFAWRRMLVWPRGEAVATVLAIVAAALLSAYPLPPGRQAAAAEEIGSGSASTEAPPVPAGAGLTLGSHAGPILVGLTVRPGAPGPNDLTIYVLGADGPEATAPLPVTARVDGVAIALNQCGDTCRDGRATLRGGESIEVDAGPQGGGPATFRLPSLPARPGEAMLGSSLAAMGKLTSYRLNEGLNSGLGTTVRSTYAFAAPNSFESTVRQQERVFDTTWIDDTRYTREDDGSWKVEHGASAPPVPTYIWDSFHPYRDVRIVGRTTLDGLAMTEVAFEGGGSDLPVWFRLWIGEDALVHRAEMRAPGHFMDHAYYDFDQQIDIAPPEGAKG